METYLRIRRVIRVLIALTFVGLLAAIEVRLDGVWFAVAANIFLGAWLAWIAMRTRRLRQAAATRRGAATPSDDG